MLDLLILAIQSDAVTGKISLTCDTWQASNTDGFFAVTGHWIEESRPGTSRFYKAQQRSQWEAAWW
jgi:hypothetical protein